MQEMAWAAAPMWMPGSEGLPHLAPGRRTEAVLRQLAEGGGQFEERHVQACGDEGQLCRGQGLRPGAGGGFGGGGDLPRGSYGRDVWYPFRRQVAWHYRPPARGFRAVR